MIYPWQTKQWSMIASLMQAERMPHAMLLHGNMGTGKTDFARHLAKSALCSNVSTTDGACGQCESCRVVDANTHPDLIQIKPLPPEKSKSKMPVLSIKIDVIRDFCNKLTRTSQYGGYRVAIIQDADYMAVNASNSLLKTLEEPGAKVLILLISSKPAKLPVTVRSRCRKMRFDLPSAHQAIAWLDGQGVKDSELALKMAHGAPLSAIALDEQQLQQRALLIKAFTATLNGEVAIKYAQELSLIPKERALNWLHDWVSDLIRLKSSVDKVELVNHDCESSLQKIASAVENKAVFGFYDLILEARKSMAIALNAQLFWESLLISWDNL